MDAMGRTVIIGGAGSRSSSSVALGLGPMLCLLASCCACSLRVVLLGFAGEGREARGRGEEERRKGRRDVPCFTPLLPLPLLRVPSCVAPGPCLCVRVGGCVWGGCRLALRVLNECVWGGAWPGQAGSEQHEFSSLALVQPSPPAEEPRPAAAGSLHPGIILPGCVWMVGRAVEAWCGVGHA